ncbi:MAG TPA: hypothetical protein VI728_10430, partial [Syntrophales bacterium]|nr:hypothetical protein [Syntrophales bacterium]
MTRWILEKMVYWATRFGFKAGRFAVKIFPRRWLFLLSDFLADVGFVFFRGFRLKSISNIG